MEQQNLEDAKSSLEKTINNLKNVEYADWDNIQISLVKGDGALVTIRMMRQDMEAIANLHNAKRSEVIEMMIAALEEEYKAKSEKL